MRDILRNNPVMVRSTIVALLSLLGTGVPTLADIAVNETVIGAGVALASIWLGLGAHQRVTPTHKITDHSDRGGNSTVRNTHHGGR
ncbi:MULTISPECIES: hypothetical protein [Streptomyces]|uniref:hypothetical protein n=1 Tax=Streptomyces TaxID=1883 RepID=UPI00069A7EC0|nr:hypothetical protein [Streptomyces sp. SID7805]MYU52090.1 hypothetical protein [Streptomyces sp. SID7805]